MHLIARFIGSVFARAPAPDDVAWVRAQLTPPEWALWSQLDRADKVESIATARRFERAVGRDEGGFIPAALLHDVGKREAGLGPVGRALATVAGALVGPAHVRGRAGSYLRHAELGARDLAAGGARPDAVRWAEAHHDPAAWAASGIPLPVCRALARADGEPEASGRGAGGAAASRGPAARRAAPRA
jgi:hypothetical protein